jgi:hypothetical protein
MIHQRTVKEIRMAIVMVLVMLIMKRTQSFICNTRFYPVKIRSEAVREGKKVKLSLALIN